MPGTANERSTRGGRRSAGLLLFRRTGPGRLEVLLGHMGGPFWTHREERAWSVPKGEYGPDEQPLDAARREFVEELGLPVPDGALVALGSLRQPSGKLLTVWALEADLDPSAVVPGTFTMPWPPGSGRLQEFPEIDRVAWTTLGDARGRLVRGQVPLLERLTSQLQGGAPPPEGEAPEVP